MQFNSISTAFTTRKAMLPAAVSIVMTISGAAHAMDLSPESNPDLSIRWDNTLRYNAGWRMEAPAPDLAARGSGISATEAKFPKNSMVTNRGDVLSEFDFIYKKDSGFRISAAGWYDAAYNNHSMPDNSAFIGGQYPHEISRYYNGPSGEILDAFVFTTINLGEVPVNVKLGQHTVMWGETLFSLRDGISSGQSYADLRKGIATPGIEAKELFKPLNQASFNAQITNELNIMGQYFFNFQPDLFPLGGTFFSPVDFLTYHGTTIVSPGLINWEGLQYNGLKKYGDWGLAAKWQPEWLNGTAGFYYRNYTPKNGGALAINAGGSVLTGASTNPAVAGIWSDPAAPKTKLFGFSLAKQISGISFGMDLTYRKDATLLTKAFTVINGPSHPFSAAATGDFSANGLTGWAPIGDVFTGTLSMIAYDGKRALWDSALLMAEFDADKLQKVTKNAQNFASVANCTKGTSDFNAGAPNQGYYGCVTKSSTGINILFEPKWFQVFEGTDLSMPLFFGRGLHGNSSVPNVAQNQNMGSYSIGVTADLNAKYNFALKFNGNLYQRKANSVTGVPFSNAALGDFSDRNWLSFTFKATL